MTTPDMAVAETIAGMTVAEAITRLRQVVAKQGPLDGGEDDDKADNGRVFATAQSLSLHVNKCKIRRQ